MAITINIRYIGKNDNAIRFANEMIESGFVAQIRNEAGNLRYEYYFPMEDDNSVLLIDSWESQEALDIHHTSKMMQKIAKLREKYDLHMQIEVYESKEANTEDNKYIRK